MINFEKLKGIKSDYPMFVVDNFLSNKFCKSIKKEIENFGSFDDFVMHGRNRLNKGSKNFKNFIKKSKNSRNLYKKINNKFFFYKLKNIIEENFNKSIWKMDIKKYNFSKSKFGLQKGSQLTNKKSKLNTVNLDIDFSLSEKGYYRSAHRDRETRIINFLIYLNSIPKKYGGALQVFSLKKKIKGNFKNYPRFPKISKLKKIAEFQPKIGKIIIFLSSPDSYHGASKFKSNGKVKRFFIYGSYSLNKIVKWNLSRND